MVGRMQLVVLMLAAHSVELFLKGALLRGFPNEDIGDYGHRLEDLSRAYRERFTESIFEWDIPFGGGEYPPGSTENCRTKKKDPEPSILYRYPIEKAGNEMEGTLWNSNQPPFFFLLKQVEDDFRRIRLQLV